MYRRTMIKTHIHTTHPGCTTHGVEPNGKTPYARRDKQSVSTEISNLLANFGASEQVLKAFSKELVSTKLPSPTAHRRQRETNHPTLT